MWKKKVLFSHTWPTGFEVTLLAVTYRGSSKDGRSFVQEWYSGRPSHGLVRSFVYCRESFGLQDDTLVDRCHQMVIAFGDWKGLAEIIPFTSHPRLGRWGNWGPERVTEPSGREPLSWVFLWSFLVPASARWVWSLFSEFSDHFLLRKEEIRIVELWFVLIRKKLSNINLPVSAGKALKRPGKKISILCKGGMIVPIRGLIDSKP